MLRYRLNRGAVSHIVENLIIQLNTLFLVFIPKIECFYVKRAKIGTF